MSADKQKLGDRRKAELERLAAMPDDDVDTTDIPAVVDWAGAEVGKFYRPVKQQMTLRIDADVLAWFKAQGPGYQTEINRVLREHVRARQIQTKRAAVARTGEICPKSGIWRSLDAPQKTVTVTVGHRMPPLDGRAVTWVYAEVA